ncbi:MAG: S8 family peptidase [Ignavibacteria bacterium]|nr:S8 family peptidase [Ignavibacteria bacterium]
MKENLTAQKIKTVQSYSKLFAIFVIIFTILSGISFSQSKSITDYYYYNNAPYYLDLNKENVYLRLKNEMTKEEFINSSQSFRQVLSYDNFNTNDKNQIIKLNISLGESGLSDLLNNLKTTGLYESVSPVFSMPEGKGNPNTLIAANNEIIVQYKSNLSNDQITTFEQSKNLTFIQNLDLRGGVTKVYRVDQNTFSMDAANDIFESGMVNYSEPNFYMTNLLSYVPNDPLFPEQWALRNTGNNIPQGVSGIPGCDMRLDSAWNITLGSNKVKIAIVDSGIDTLHEDLAANILPNSQFNFITNSTNAFDDNGHGTGCSGIAAASGNNSLGISGVAPNSKIINIKCLNNEAAGTYEDLIEGLIYSWQIGAWVSSNSWGGLPPVSGVDNAILDGTTLGRNGKGTVFCFATGNSNTVLAFPSINPNVIAVGGLSPCNQRKSPVSCDGENWGANYGTGLNVVAPCVKVYTTDITGSGGWSNTNYLDNFNGTSGAAPNVAGICALMLSADSTLSWDKVRKYLNNSADKTGNYSYNSTGPLSDLGRTWNNEMGYGKANAYNAVRYVLGSKGFTFNHNPLTNNDNLSGPYSVTSSIVSLNGAINPAETKLFWTRGSSFDSIPMTNSGGNNWTATIPGTGAPASYKYFIKATDVTGVSKTYPVLAPGTYFSFNVINDNTPPQISHSSAPVIPIQFWPYKIKSIVTDSIGIDSVWVKWYKNNPSVIKHFKLQNTLDDNFEAAFNSVNIDVSNGDSIFYRIFAQDKSNLHTSDSTSLNKIKISIFNLSMDFVSPEFPPPFWNLEYTDQQFWTRHDVSAYGIGTGSAKFNYWNARPGVTQYMTTNPFDESVTGDSLKFDHAYRCWQAEDDSLIIETSTNAGVSFSLLIGLVGGPSGPLTTAPPSQILFVPNASQWATKKYALPVGVNMIRFKAVSAFGNNLYVDNILKVNGMTGISNNLITEMPEKYSLSQNYPNPFNPVTNVEFGIMKLGFVSLKIYDVLGKEVATLVNENLQPGTYKYNFDASNLSSGIYFYRIKAGDFIETRSMMLLK